MTHNSKIRLIVVNALVAAAYIVLSTGPAAINMASGAIQFRISEGLNHLVIFNKKYIWGVVGGVLIFNALFSSLGWLDIVFGGGQSLIGLLLVGYLAPHLKQVWQRYVLNILVMTVSMFLIAIELHIAYKLPFWPTYGTTALSEFIIMAVTAPIMAAVDRAVHFKKQVD